MSEDNHKKMLWLRPAMNGDNDAVIQALLNTLPATDSLSSDETKRLDVARGYMAELFARGVGKDQFLIQTGLTGFPVDPKLEGLERHEMAGSCPIYYNFWLAQKDPTVSAKAIKEILLSRQSGLDAQYHPWYRLQLCIDVDTDDRQPMPLEAGLTSKAICLEFGLGEVESAFARIDEACQKLSKPAKNKLRITLGTFAQQEFNGLNRLSIFSKRLPYRMGTEWILFKNIHARAGKKSSRTAAKRSSRARSK